MGAVVSTRSELVVNRSVRRRSINIVPKPPAADDEYTPAQGRVIDARLRQARKGPYRGPFPTADEAITFVRKQVRKRKRMKRAS
jgi:hypothetical protein